MAVSQMPTADFDRKHDVMPENQKLCCALFGMQHGVIVICLSQPFPVQHMATGGAFTDISCA